MDKHQTQNKRTFASAANTCHSLILYKMQKLASEMIWQEEHETCNGKNKGGCSSNLFQGARPNLKESIQNTMQ